MVKGMAEALMDAEVDALCGAAHGERHPERTNRRNGYRERAWDTRTGTIELAVPKLRAGSYFPFALRSSMSCLSHRFRLKRLSCARALTAADSGHAKSTTS